jgi:hypothetical protein
MDFHKRILTLFSEHALQRFLSVASSATALGRSRSAAGGVSVLEHRS